MTFWDLHVFLSQAIQRRLSGAVNFNTTWANFKNGFGDPEDSYWIGKSRDLFRVISRDALFFFFFFWYITKTFSWKFFNFACKRGLGKTTVDRRHGQLTVVFLKGEILTGVFFFILIYSNLKEYKNGLVKIIIFPLINFCRFIKQVKHNRYCIIDLYMHKRVR